MSDIYTRDNTKFYPIHIFFKFGPKSRLIEMQRSGYLYMKRLKYFVDLKKNTSERGKSDINEARLFHTMNIKIIDPKTKKLLITAKRADLCDSNELNKPIFCITAINIFENIIDFNYPSFKSKIIFDERMISDFQEGEESCHVLVITNTEEFLKRIRIHCLSKGIGYRYELVKYRDTRYLHQINEMIEFNTAFHKDSYFEYQKEFRIIIDKQVDDYYDFSIGNIEEISKIMLATNLIDGFLIEGNIDKIDLE